MKRNLWENGTSFSLQVKRNIQRLFFSAAALVLTTAFQEKKLLLPPIMHTPVPIFRFPFTLTPIN